MNKKIEKILEKMDKFLELNTHRGQDWSGGYNSGYESAIAFMRAKLKE